MATPISPSVQDSLQTLDARVELNLLEVLAKSYGEGFVKAVEGMEAKPQIKKDDSRLLKEDVARMTRPIQDYNKALAGKVDEMVRDSFAAGKDDTEVAKILRARIPEILNNEPLTIQRPGKRPVSFTAEEYADLVSNVVPYAVRNEGYIRGLKEAGADGWQSVAVGDERMCPMCGEKHGQVYGWEDPKPPYHPKCRCRPVAYFRPRTKEDKAESERIKAKALEKPWEAPEPSGAIRYSSQITTREDLIEFASTSDWDSTRTPSKSTSLLGVELKDGESLYTHAVRNSSDLDSIMENGLLPMKGDKFFASEAPLVRDRGSGFVVFKAKPSLAKESIDFVETGLTYPEVSFKSKISKDKIVRVVEAVPVGSGINIRADQLAKYALENPGLTGLEYDQLPDKYKHWFRLDTPSSKKVADQLIDDIIPKKMAYPGSKIERPKLEHKAIDIHNSPVINKAVADEIAYMNGGAFPSVSGKGDIRLKNLAEEIGFSEMPTIVTEAELDKIVAEGHRELWRGLGQNKPGEFTDLFRSGDYFAGEGIYGNGIYTGTGEGAKTLAALYAPGDHGAVMRMAIDKDAKVITVTELKDRLANEQKLLRLDRSSEEAFAASKVKRSFMEDPGRAAVVWGYDAIDAENGQFIVLNRKAIYVQATDYTREDRSKW